MAITIEERLGYRFQNQDLLRQALTHRSYLKDDGVDKSERHNERLEFLGDAVLSLASAEQLFALAPNADEGVLSQLRAVYVCEPNLAQGGRRVGLGEFLRVSKSMRGSGPVDLDSVLADAVEALFGAAYLDGGLEVAKNLVITILGPVSLQHISQIKDAKTELQEKIQGILSVTPTYLTTETLGPAHAPQFVVQVSVLGQVLGQGSGPSKRDAAQEAAKMALERLKAMDEDEILKSFQS